MDKFKKVTFFVFVYKKNYKLLLFFSAVIQKYFDCSSCKRFFTNKTSVSKKRKSSIFETELNFASPSFTLNSTINKSNDNKPVSIEHLAILLIDDKYQFDELFRFTFFCKLFLIYIINMLK